MGPERLEGPSPPGGQRVHLCLKRQGWGDERQGARERLALTFLATWDEEEQKSGYWMLRRPRTVRDMRELLFGEFWL